MGSQQEEEMKKVTDSGHPLVVSRKIRSMNSGKQNGKLERQ